MHGTGRPSVDLPLQRPAPPSPPAADRVFELRSLIDLIIRRKWAVIGTMAVIICLSLLFVSQLQQRFTATALIAIDSRDDQLLGFQTSTQDSIAANSMVDTDVEIAQSSTVLGGAAEQLNLVAWPEFAARPPLLDRLKSIVGLATVTVDPTTQPKSFASLSDRERTALVSALSHVINISRRGLTSIIAISATDRSAEGAAQIANAVGDAYLQEEIEARLTSAQQASAFLRERVDGLASDVTQLEAQIDSYVTSKMSEIGSPAAKALMAQLQQVTNDRDSSGASLSQLQAGLQSGDFDRLSGMLDSAQADLAAQRRSLVAELTATDQDRVAAAREKLASLDQEIQAAANQRATSLQSALNDADSRITDLHKQLDSALAATTLPSDFSAQFYQLQHELDARRSLYETFLSKLGQVEQQSDFQLPDSRVIAAATPPERPSFPPSGAIAVATFILALVGGVGFAFLRENFIGGINSVEQFESIAGTRVLATVPRRARTASVERPEAAVLSEPLSSFSESIRRLRMGIEGYAVNKRIRVFVTSPLPGDGKTTIALALARQTALSGRRTLLIDADMRHPSIHTAIGESPERGLLDFLAEPAGQPDQLAIVKESESGLDFILGPKASVVATDALLMSDRFADLMKFASENYDAIIIDTPPIGLVVDARIVAKFCDVCVFVVRSGVTNQHSVRAAMREVRTESDIPICGVLNEVRHEPYYAGGYGRKYRAYYQ